MCADGADPQNPPATNDADGGHDHMPATFGRDLDAVQAARDSARYSNCISASRRVRWDIDADVLRGRDLDFGRPFLPQDMTLAGELSFVDAAGCRALSQVQARSYAGFLGLAGRFVAAKLLETSRDHCLGDQLAFEAHLRCCDEELKHQALFRQLDRMMEDGMPPGYRRVADPNGYTHRVLARSSWAALALACHVELLAQAHYTRSIAASADMPALLRDALRFHWLEECHHAIVDEIAWRREDGRLTPRQRDRAVSDLIELYSALADLAAEQAAADTAYFLAMAGQACTQAQSDAIAAVLVRAYCWQYIGAGLQHPQFAGLLTTFTTAQQMQRLRDALAPVLRDRAEAAAA